MVTKQILSQYIQIQKEIKEVRQRISKTEEQLRKIEEEGNVVDKVSGGDGGIQSFKIEGFPYRDYSRKKTLLYSRKTTLELLEIDLDEAINQVEEFIKQIDDSYIRRIITFRFLDGLSWEAVSAKIGGGNSADGVRKAFERFMEK